MPLSIRHKSGRFYVVHPSSVVMQVLNIAGPQNQIDINIAVISPSENFTKITILVSISSSVPERYAKVVCVSIGNLRSKCHIIIHPIKRRTLPERPAYPIARAARHREVGQRARVAAEYVVGPDARPFLERPERDVAQPCREFAVDG